MKGFTLIESLVAITIVAVAVAGPLFTANRAIISAQGARLQLTASHLAQEGIEHIRALRDNEYLIAYKDHGADIGGTAWTIFRNEIELACPTAEGCTVDSDPTLTLGTTAGESIRSCGGTCEPLYLTNGVNKIYTRSIVDAEKQPYTRKVQVVRVSDTDERIVSTVTWFFHDIQSSVEISDHVTPWQ